MIYILLGILKTVQLIFEPVESILVSVQSSAYPVDPGDNSDKCQLIERNLDQNLRYQYKYFNLNPTKLEIHVLKFYLPKNHNLIDLPLYL